jgi:inorganic triphosphatase YgiF
VIDLQTERLMSSEIELKFRVPPRKLAFLGNARIAGSSAGSRSKQELVSTYFDTAKHKLQQRGLTLRVRRSDDGYVQTVKSADSGRLARGEWEAKVEGGVPDLRKVKDTPLEPLASKKLHRKLKPVFRTDVRRVVVRPVSVKQSKIELAVDRGSLVAGRRSRPIAEFELELASGRPLDLFDLAKSLERRTGAELDLRSKAQQGYRLVDDDKDVAIHAEPVELDGDLTAAEAFNVIAHSTLRHFSANADAVRDEDAEAIHQMRVGLRRTRAAISLFGRILPRASTEKIKAELKWLTNELAPAREIDVFIKEQLHPKARTIDPRRGARAIERQFAAKKADAFRRAREALNSSRFRRLLIDVLEWLETRDSRASGEANQDIGWFASDLLYRRIRKAHKAGRSLADLSTGERHKLRIRIKKIRYAIDFFESLYLTKGRQDLANLSDRLKAIQDALGALNDFNAHREMVTEVALNAPPADRRARAFASGIVVGEEREAAKTLIKTASKELRRLHPRVVQRLQ